MSTNFFELQTAARRNTGWLIFSFLLATVIIVVSVMAVAGLAIQSQQGGRQVLGTPTFPWDIPILAGAVTLMLIIGGTLFKSAQLRAGGGAVVAEAQGGVRIYPDTADPIQRRILNIVEEIAIASGTPVPPVYFLENEPGINAFAAGYTPSDAVIAVTRGSAEELTRDELQGVIAHEFSHIVNGDVRIGIRMIGVLYGILLMGLVGQLIFRSMAWSGGFGSRRDSKSGNATAVIMLVGLALIILGFIGTLLGNLIKAAVSRQRERLADASGVQFTRNPLGLAGALKRIGALENGSRMQSPNAAEASHLFFADGVWTGFARMWATHPPLAERIRALDPNWDGTYPAPHAAAAEIRSEAAAGFVGASFASGPGRQTEIPLQVVNRATEQIGNPTPAHNQYAASLVGGIPDQLIAAAHQPYAARAMVLSLLVHADVQVRAQQLGRLAQLVKPDLSGLVQQLLPAVDGLDPRARLPLVDMSLPALAAMSPAQYAEFLSAFSSLAQADGQLELFEWVLAQIVMRNLRPRFERIRGIPVRYQSLEPLADQCSVVLSAVAHAGNSGVNVQAAFNAAAAYVPDLKLDLRPREASGLGPLQKALADLRQVALTARARLIQACAAAIAADRHATLSEAELLRGISDLLECPMPPLLPGETISDANAIVNERFVRG